MGQVSATEQVSAIALSIAMWGQPQADPAAFVERVLPLPLVSVEAAVSDMMVKATTPRMILCVFVMMNFLSVKVMNVPSNTVFDGF
jgi:hypothetical protein